MQKKEKIRYFSVIRIIGLFLVLAYHFFIEKLPGGFLGVDIFFTFSGYLITSLIINEINLKNSFSLFLYLKKRFLRIFPSLFLAIFLTFPFLNFLPKDYLAGIDKQIASALSFTSNYFFIKTGTSYEANLLPQIYIHTWSLALEMQFYVFTGLLIFFVNFIFSKINKKFKNGLKASVFIIFLLITMLFYFNMQRLYVKDPSIAYFSSFSHTYSFFIGAAFSLLFGINLPDKIKKSINKNLTLPISFLAMASTFSIIFLAIKSSFKNSFTYRLSFLICSLVTCLLILCFRFLHEIVPKNIKEPFILSHLANVSYPMYLFHWPFYIIFLNLISNKLFVALLTFVVSYIFSLIVNYLTNSFKILVKNKNIFKPCVGVFLAILVLNINTILKIPNIKEIEKEQLLAGLVQNLDYLKSINENLENIKIDPVLQKSGIKNFSTLNFNSKEEQKIHLDPKLKLMKRENKIKDNKIILPAPFKCSKVKIIGDSVALGARKALLEAVPDSFVDTKGSRSLEDGYNIIKEWWVQDPSFEYLVVSLGTNGRPDANDYVNKIINDLKSGQRVIFVTPFDGRWNETWFSFKTANYLRSLKDKYSFVTIADWASEISTRKELLGSDRTHIGGNTVAIKLYVSTVLNALNEAKNKEAKK